jgi:hypothetical protein
MRLTPRYMLGFLGACVTLLPLASYGQATNSHAPPNTAQTKRIEGIVARVDRNELLLKVKGGTTETYQLSPALKIARSQAAPMADLTAGKFVGCINLYGQSDKKVAGECSILPDGLRGLVENRDDVASAESAWISGTISAVRDDADAPGKGRSIWIQISGKDHATTMAVTPVTRVTILSASDASALRPGVKVQGVSQLAVDGTGVIQTLTVVE